MREQALTFWSSQPLLDAMQGRWLLAPGEGQAASLVGVSIDSRAVAPGEVFVALRGDRFDGHDFLNAAIDRGAAMLVVDRETKAADFVAKLKHAGTLIPVMLVDDSVTALQRAASTYRDRLRAAGVTIVAVVGSNGKTTTRHIIHATLRYTLKGTQSPKSFNNHIGVPLTLLAAGESDNFVVVEMGTNHPGELAALGEIVRPDIAVLTSIGHEHMEFFRTIEGVAREEASISAFIAPGGLAVVNAQAMQHVKPFWHRGENVRLLTFGRESDGACDLQLDDASLREQTTGLKFATKDGLAIDLPLIGRHNAVNALAAIAVGRWLKLSDAAIRDALRVADAPPMRLQIKRFRTPGDSGVIETIIINDAYNANPDSVESALHTLASYPRGSVRGRRVAILGDMFELGDEGPQLHRQCGRLLASLGGRTDDAHDHAIHRAILIGKLSSHTAEAAMQSWPAQRVTHLPQWSDDVPARVAAMIEPGDVVLIKASRGMGLERLIPAMEQKLNAATSTTSV